MSIFMPAEVHATAWCVETRI